MNYKELMVGDWVNYKSPSSGKLRSIKIENIYGAEFNCEVENWNIISGKSISDTEPIPLTEDILVKNGFSYTANVIGRHNCKCYELEQKGVYHMTISIYKNEITCELDKVDAMYMNVVTNCVHQLQHLLRLCGIERELIV